MYLGGRHTSEVQHLVCLQSLLNLYFEVYVAKTITSLPFLLYFTNTINLLPFTLHTIIATKVLITQEFVNIDHKALLVHIYYFPILNAEFSYSPRHTQYFCR